MPSDNKEMNCEYKDMISQLSEVIEKYRNTHEIVICGDMNGSAHLVYRLFLPIFFLFELSLEHDQTYFLDPYP
jgi:hypothetical protein